MRRNLLTASAAVLIASLAAASMANEAQAASPREVRRLIELNGRAWKQIEGRQYTKALSTAEKVAVLAPAAPPHYLRACAHAGLLDLDAAFAELRRAVDLGTTPETLRTEEALAPLRGDPRFAEVVSAAERDQEAWKERMRVRYRETAPDTAESFDTAEALAQAFDGRAEEHRRQMPLLPWREWWSRSIDLQNARIAALERYIADRPEAPDRERAYHDATLAAVALHDELDEGWGAEAGLVAARAARYLDAFAAGSHVAESERLRAVAAWMAFDEDDREATLAGRAERALPLFESIEGARPGPEEALRSRTWRLRILHETSGGGVTDAQRALHAAIEAGLAALDAPDGLVDEVWERARPAMFRIEAEEGFDAVDLSGKRWTFDALRGQVVLVDFWSTWCGPCMKELPHLAEAYEKYHDRGFEIIGVSLDGPGRKAFDRALVEHGIVWPQIWDGQGFEAALASRFHIRWIPTPFLLDREGRIVAWGDRARGAKLVELVAGLVR